MIDFTKELTIFDPRSNAASEPESPISESFFIVPSTMVGIAKVRSLEFNRLFVWTVFAPARIKIFTWSLDKPDPLWAGLNEISPFPILPDILEELELSLKLLCNSWRIWPVCEFGSVTTKSSIFRDLLVPSASIMVNVQDSYCPLERGM